MITLTQLKQITNQKEYILSAFVEPLNYTIELYSINTPTRLTYFISQICHESGSFRYTEEIASGDAYDTRVDLGNTPQIDGDGRLYKGRGLIQLTGKNNYKKLSIHFKEDFIFNPGLLKQPAWACKSAGWFWSMKKLNKVADDGDFLMVTYLINGGFNGLEDRLKYLVKAYRYFQFDGLSKQLNNVFLDMDFNIEAAKLTHFRKMLFKAIPDRETIKKLKETLIAINN